MTRAFAPRVMKASAAAHYLGVSAPKSRGLDLPRRESGGNMLCDQADLDAWADRLPYERQEPEENAFDALLGLSGEAAARPSPHAERNRLRVPPRDARNAAE